jgi:hypothetical protein
MLAVEPPMDEACIECLDQQFRDRWQSLISVDELVEAVVLTLEKWKVLDSTYIMYSSDHGCASSSAHAARCFGGRARTGVTLHASPASLVCTPLPWLFPFAGCGCGCEAAGCG